MAASQAGRTDQGEYVQAVHDAVVAAYYPRVLSAADAARARAQNAYAVASAIAGGLVGFGILTSFRSYDPLIRVGGLSAVLAWLISARLYSKAIAAPVWLEMNPKESTPRAFIDAALAAARSEREEVDRRQSIANSAAMVAMILTGLTVGAGLFLPARSESFTGQVALKSDATKAIAPVCPSRPTAVRGRIDRQSFDRQFVVIRVPANVCQKEPVTLRIAVDQIAASGS